MTSTATRHAAASMRPRPAAVLDAVVQQHAEEAAMLRDQRSHLVQAPQADLAALAGLDERIEAHLDGLAEAGPSGVASSRDALGNATPGSAAGETFALGVLALRGRDDALLDELVAAAEGHPDRHRGLSSAFGWVSAEHLQGVVRRTLASPAPHARVLALTACRMHRVDPGPALAAALGHADAALRSQSLRTAGSLGRLDLLDVVRAALHDEGAAFEAARALCLLGEHKAALPVLEAHALDEGPDLDGTRLAALALLLQAAEFEHGQHILRSTARSANGNPDRERLVIHAIGLLGDVQRVPWLIDRMADDGRARLAGEAFSMITGADLGALTLERSRPDNPPGGASDDPDDTNVALDEDEGLPWPDRERVRQWWDKRAATLPASGRCFMGMPPSVAHCEQVLRAGTQRQRIAAAHYVCVLQPGRSLFNCAAPAWRQQRLLAGMP